MCQEQQTYAFEIVAENFQLQVSQKTISNILKQHDFTHKVFTYVYTKYWDKNHRAAFCDRTEQGLQS